MVIRSGLSACFERVLLSSRGRNDDGAEKGESDPICFDAVLFLIYF